MTNIDDAGDAAQASQVIQRLCVLVGLNVSGIGHAADMLTMHFGPLKQYRTRRGTLLEVGAWALHIQCRWYVERGGEIFANHADFQGTDEETNRTTERLNELLVAPIPAVVENVWSSATGDVEIILSRGLRIVVTSDGVTGDEDWRFFAPDSDERHFVIEGGKIDPDSLA